jgi:predicted metal-dependent HD superfamily phosphohydrolase
VHHGDVEDLLQSWTGLISRHTDDPDGVRIGRRLLASWSEPNRSYHSIGHLRDILARVEELTHLAEDPDAVRLAAWYHDAEYGGLPDDEERSARRAEQELSALGVAPRLVDEVARLVRMTVSHDPAPGDHNAEVLSDADLAPLALPREHYRRNSAAIRTEYPHVPDEVFCKGRRQVLCALLESPAIFRTDAGRQRWEDAARDNLRAELTALDL